MLRDDEGASARRQAALVLPAIPGAIEQQLGKRGEQAADADGDESEAGEAGAEVVDALEDDGEGVEEGEEDGEVEADVDAQEGDDGFGDDHVEGAEERDCQEEFEGGEAGGAGAGGEGEALLKAAVLEDYFFVGFFLGEGEEDGEGGEHEDGPLARASGFFV